MTTTDINNVGAQLANWLGDTESNYGHETKNHDCVWCRTPVKTEGTYCETCRDVILELNEEKRYDD